MSTGLVVMTINQLISEIKKFKGIKERKIKILTDLEKLNMNMRKVKIQNILIKQYNQLNVRKRAY